MCVWSVALRVCLGAFRVSAGGCISGRNPKISITEETVAKFLGGTSVAKLSFYVYALIAQVHTKDNTRRATLTPSPDATEQIE